ncbi:Transcription-associated protein 1, partial [Fasciolopsis buskii]
IQLANEAPRIDLCRYALIHAAACVAGRRSSSGFAAAVAAAQVSASSGISSSDSDPYGAVESGVSVCNSSTPSSAQTANMSGSASGTATVSVTSGSPMSASNSSGTGTNPAVSSVVSIIQASEAESHRIMSTVLREWRRMPLIITTQHVPLLQIAHRAVEVTEGNSLLAQYCGHVLSGPSVNQPISSGSVYTSPGQSGPGSSTSGVNTSGAGSSAVSSAALRMPLSQALHDYKTVFKWWQSRPPSIGDDLGFWHDLFSWRQVVEESIITYHPYLQKFGPERVSLLRSLSSIFVI